MHSFNSQVTYVRNGKSIPAIVLKSQIAAEGELLTLLYADPEAGPGMIAQGTVRGIGSVASAVAPMADGKTFGWHDGANLPDAGEAQHFLDNLMPHLVNLSHTVSDIDPSMEISPDGVLKSAKALLEKFPDDLKAIDEARKAALAGNDTAVAELRKVADELNKANDAYSALGDEHEKALSTIAYLHKQVAGQPPSNEGAKQEVEPVPTNPTEAPSSQNPPEGSTSDQSPSSSAVEASTPEPTEPQPA